MKVMVVVLVAIGVAVVLVLFYGALRPDGEADDAKDGVDGGLGWLIPRPGLVFADVDDAECADPDIPGFSVGPGVCAMALDAPSQITLCTPTPGTVLVTTHGSEYPEQVVKQERLNCAKPQAISIYDTDTILRLRCIVGTSCVVVVVDPNG